MNSKKILKAGVIVALMSLPLYASEKTEGEVALNACAEALATKIETANGQAVSFNVDPKSKGTQQKVNHRDVIYLDAKAPNSDEIIARANCIVNGDATVAKLVALPLSAPKASVRARKAY